MFRRQVLTSEEAAAIVASVPADRLIHISDTVGPLPFFTVGPYWAYHKNKTGGAPPLTSRTSYERAMETEREYLKAAFGGLLEDVRDILEQSLRDGPVRFAPGLSLPGFHYIYSHAAWQFPVFNMREISREQPRRQSWPRLAEMSRDSFPVMLSGAAWRWAE